MGEPGTLLTLPETEPRYHRRVFLGAVVAGAGVYWAFDRQSRELERVASLPVTVRIALFDDAGRPTGVVSRLRIHRSDD